MIREVFKKHNLFFAAIFISLIPAYNFAQSWRVDGVTELNRSTVEDAVRTVDGVSTVIVDIQSKTLNVIPRPKAMITSDQIVASLKLVPDIKLGQLLTTSPPPVTKAPQEEKLKFPPDKMNPAKKP